MNRPIKIGITGFGNLGKGAEKAILQNPDMELTAVFTRRSPQKIDSSAKVYSIDELEKFKGKLDVMLLCGGSAEDLPEQILQIPKWFNTVDSFDTHAKIPDHFANADEIAKNHNTLCLISTGWDPGLFSIMRLLGASFLPEGDTYTFWGPGLSQGHSDAIRRIPGVKNAVQYTIPKDQRREQILKGDRPTLSTADKHERVCYVVADGSVGKAEIEEKIKNMPFYFADYHTEVRFVTEEELLRNHSGMPHGGQVFRNGTTGNGTKQQMEFRLKLESNPEFTAGVLVAYARAVARLAAEGQTGARTVFDIPPGYLSPMSGEELRRTIL